MLDFNNKFKNIFDNKKVLIISLIIISIIIVASLCIFNKRKQNKENYFLDDFSNNEIVSDSPKEDTKSKELLYVHIIGEVNNPGIIEIEENMRIFDVVEKAGGFTDEADVSKVNLAYIAKDGQKIIIPNKNQIEENKYNDNDSNKNNTYILEGAGESIIEGEIDTKGKVNINTASQTELETVNGIGPSLASKIIQYRTANGKFESVEDLNKVSGIGKAKYESIKDFVIAK